MRDYTKKRQCSVVVGSMTQAIRAQRLLELSSIRAEIIKAGFLTFGYGCAYALSYPCFLDANVRRLLKDARLLQKESDGRHT